MKPHRLVGVALIVVGLALIGVGVTSSDSLVDRVSETFTGRYTRATMRYFIGGGVTSVIGALLLFFPARRTK